MNYFIHASTAERYARGRPYFHPLVIDRVRSLLQLARPVPAALDVACGTGQSALALTEVASSVIAIDVSPAMLAQAPAHERICYREAPAEELPLEDQSVDLITVSLAFHWLDRTPFLAEARRVLRRGGTLVIYWNDFYGRMKENAKFESWTFASYLKRYPKPPRNNQPLTEDDARINGFTFVSRERYTNDIVFSPEELVHCLMTHSNIIAAVERDGESISDAHSWLIDTVSPLFENATGTFVFGGEIWCLRHIE